MDTYLGDVNTGVTIMQAVYVSAVTVTHRVSGFGCKIGPLNLGSKKLSCITEGVAKVLVAT